MASPSRADTTTSSAERVKRHRARRKRGAFVLRVECSSELARWMISEGWIGEDQGGDRGIIEDALSDVLFCLAQGTLSAHPTGSNTLPPSVFEPAPVCYRSETGTSLFAIAAASKERK